MEAGEGNADIPSSPVRTAFAILFLIRSTKKSLGSERQCDDLIGGRKASRGTSASQSLSTAQAVTPRRRRRQVTDMLSLLGGRRCR